MDRANVPKFGNWENEGNDVPYTAYFDKARKNKPGSDPESAQNFTHTGEVVNSFNPKQPSTTRSQPCDDEPKKAASCFPRWW